MNFLKAPLAMGISFSAYARVKEYLQYRALEAQEAGDVARAAKARGAKVGAASLSLARARRQRQRAAVERRALVECAPAARWH